jgi:flavin reductase (DIM6/NTAB) family NADH-FMN oxidoreductase RutF
MTKQFFDIVPVDVEPVAFRSVMRHVAGAVSVVTANADGARAGLTATSLTSLSAEPPAVLVCVNRSASAWPVIERAGHFAVNVLGPGHRPIADRFAGRGGFKGEERFGEGAWSRLATGAPILEDALAVLDCDIEEVIVRHSHAILIGRVKAIREAGTEGALLYWRGLYGQLDEALQHGAGI